MHQRFGHTISERQTRPIAGRCAADDTHDALLCGADDVYGERISRAASRHAREEPRDISSRKHGNDSFYLPGLREKRKRTIAVPFREYAIGHYWRPARAGCFFC
ncbi:MAG: hypothetical protein A3C90_03295 [Candidatus Magasanikbacteria bacterium RIFCSPHIGHO2_02_FULL_51_14]|uniref:Uncharacterized protein n=1 Tax=Candidatus Magasanikbacteria bacterium RIFCSPHIGHO2_02_FULL_51_14 TaxID=1798683 RepID=A0A1F6MR32_9BACT|nr:MAG: hypothetical protein A3C90_03295 [Candidatus Magasanikbacteria bacterium RIFCSPHIGHO2_02_FULL_51_14]